MSIWNDIDLLSKIARFVPYSLIILGFLIAISGEFIKTKIETRISKLKSEAKLIMKNTKPELDAFIAKSEKTGKLLLVIDTKNKIPFSADWFVTTEADVIVSGILIEKPVIHPQKSNQRFTHQISIDTTKVKNDYIELRFSFDSIYSSELNDPRLKDHFVKKYKFVDGNVFHWENFHNMAFDQNL